MAQQLSCIEVGRNQSRRVMFVDLISPVVAQVRNHYWMISGDVLLGEAPNGTALNEKELEDLIIKRRDEWLIAKPAMVNRYARFVGNDWCHIVAVSESAALSAPQRVDKAFLEEEAEIYLRCVDGAYWLVISRKPELVVIIAQHFSTSRSIQVEDAKSLSYLLA